MERLRSDKGTILNLAAVTTVLYSTKHPDVRVEVDVNGTLNIPKAMRNKNDGALLVFTSTDKVYEEPKCLPID